MDKKAIISIKEATLEINFSDYPSPDKSVNKKTEKRKTETNKRYSQNKVLKNSIAYFKGDELAASVWMNKYALKDSNGNIYELTPNDMHWRIAREVARIEDKHKNSLSVDEIYAVLSQFRYIIPQGGSMAGIGNDYQLASLSNCFVVGNKANTDSYGGILKIDEEQFQLKKRVRGRI